MRPDNWREVGIDEDQIVEFDVHCKMNKAWANEFLSMLKAMQVCGNIGVSRRIALYADGDGDLRPKFSTDFKYTERQPISVASDTDLFDAG
jgi:hypothetical protein